MAERAPSSSGVWFGWAQNSHEKPAHDDFYVQRGTQAPIKVNATKTQGHSGGVVGHTVFYVQQHGKRHPRINSFDLETGHREQLPAKVNHYRHTAQFICCPSHTDKDHVLSGVRGNATVSGSWLLYSGFMEDLDRDVYPYDTVMLYNHVNHKLRTVAAYLTDAGDEWAGQVNGRFVTYWSFGRYGGSEVYRYNIRTQRSVKLPWLGGGEQYDPAVSSDGTVYYFMTDEDAPLGGPYDIRLIRQPIGAPAEVVTTLTSGHYPGETYVSDRADGSRVVFFYWKHNIYKVVDRP